MTPDGSCTIVRLRYITLAGCMDPVVCADGRCRSGSRTTPLQEEMLGSKGTSLFFFAGADC